MSIVKSLRRARIRSGESLRKVASRSGVGAGNLSAIENGHRDPTSSTLDRLASTIGVEWIPFPARGRTPAAVAAEEITHAEAQGRHAQAYRRFLQLSDDLAASDPVTRVLLSAEEPDDSPSRWVDAVAALVEVRLREASAPIPVWVTEHSGHSDAIWEPQRSSRALPLSADRTQVPAEFLRRGVAIESGELISA
ncbi:helix-turn-helix transcriptional regulator [Microbacterium sp. VKM Ac-2923]|uniref:helix-turn-helix domain-containing protein n=1 Tax=Microbacterium sp. VKM Ac-2923 TaxID=2929476 RepID=UPI00243715B8|nr:helix-turn-helix transcriptional regulator [Microbacterium sp. VKM Ac-2923]